MFGVDPVSLPLEEDEGIRMLCIHLCSAFRRIQGTRYLSAYATFFDRQWWFESGMVALVFVETLQFLSGGYFPSCGGANRNQTYKRDHEQERVLIFK